MESASIVIVRNSNKNGKYFQEFFKSGFIRGLQTIFERTPFLLESEKCIIPLCDAKDLIVQIEKCIDYLDFRIKHLSNWIIQNPTNYAIQQVNISNHFCSDEKEFEF